MQTLVEEALQILRTQYQGANIPDTSHMPVFDELFLKEKRGEPFTNDLPFKFRGPDAPILFLHSSGQFLTSCSETDELISILGSTAFPKPIMYTHHRMLLFCMIPYYGEQDLNGIVFSMHMMPMFHGMGMALMLWTVRMTSPPCSHCTRRM